VIQINFSSKDVDKDTNEIIDKYYLMNHNNYLLTNKLQIHNINIVKCYDVWYNKNINKYNSYEQNIIRFGALMRITKKDEFIKCLEEISMNKDIKEEINNVMDDMNSDEEVLIYYDKEQHEQAIRNTLITEAITEGRNIGIEEGSLNKQIEIAKNMFLKEIDINTISECTGLSIEEIEKLEDMGRDLIVSRENVTYIIQCRNWSEHKEIHEKHVFQLFGTVSTFKIDNPMTNVRGIFVTSTRLSDMAKMIAEMLEITVMENIPLGEFPRIKCNINRGSNEKIYHLPFDQQYDSTVINTNEGECYAFTVKEAEEKGFRRAFKHKERA
jgi:hypothetical protein